MSKRRRPSDADAQLIRATALRVALTITLAVSVLVLAVLIAAFSVVFTQIPLGDLLSPQRHETVVDIEGLDIILGGAVIGVCAIASAGVLGWLVTRRAVRPLVDALRRQRQFVADASHELRTPLAILDARIQVLQRGLADADPHRQVVAELRDDSRSVIGVVSDLLDAVEVPTGSVTTPASLAGITDTAVSSMSILARERDVHLVSRPPDDDLTVAMPAASLQRSVVALLDNAVKHSPVGAKVVVTARREGAHAVIDVVDEGPGIQGIAPSRIFDRFARSADAVDGGGSSRTGFGIGLSLVQDTVARYGGTAQVSATSSAGTTMTLRVPLFSGRR
ncbi:MULTISPECIES: ATP-binding protein [unclassified Microbacterium]|uniref:ATP-binding protein n=1 Tax=unclassified Microbacterium TaxID=2609290 RepID=UPI00136E487C|nr:HAMP domain-containing histidine kinase [Microbacterium sp. TL13]